MASALAPTVKLGIASADWSRDTEPYTLGGSGYARCGVPARYSRHQVTVGMLAFNTKTGELLVKTPEGELVNGFDVILMQRWMSDDLPARIRRARAGGQVIINDVDDWYWGLATTNSAFGQSQKQAGRVEHRDAYWQILCASDAVFVSTPYLAGRLPAHLTKFVWRNGIELNRFRQRVQQERPVIGWVGAVPFRSSDLETLKGILGPFVERHDLRLFHGGHYPGRMDPAPFWKATGVDPGRVAAMALVPSDRYPDLLTQFDIGLVPLADVPFNRAKSAIKGLEYAAAGIPFVAQATPEYVGLGAIGKVAAKPKRWLHHLEALLSPEARVAEARRNRQLLDRYDAEAQVDLWDNLVEHVRLASAA